MLYPKNIEQKLGFDTIREFLRNECLSPLGQAYVEKIRFSTDVELVCKMQLQTEDFRKLLIQNLPFPSTNYLDVSSLLEKLRPEGAFLEAEEFLQLKLSIHTITSCIVFLDKHQLDFHTLFLLRKEVVLDENIYRQLNLIIDENGSVRDNASQELGKIRKVLTQEQQRLRHETDKLLKYVKKEGYTDDDIAPTLRNGRMVIPIKAEFKRRVKGFIHDESASGQTSFIEPAEIFEINNAIKECELSEKREIIRILTELSYLIRPHLHALKKAYVFLGIIDFIRAKAKLSIALDSSLPIINSQTGFDWHNAFHPVLKLSSIKNGKLVVPFGLTLDSHQRIVLISGPNAGGKSVCLKAVGLIQYMFQCGLPIPVDESSTIGFFQDIFIDMGDEQSLENDLSTYSAHLSNMREFIKLAGKKSLVLIDEFGTGTEPQFGAAIAESVLEALHKSSVYGIITTHYSNLKSFAENTPGLTNAAMAYDIEKLEPLYRLEIGKPGSSYAFEIAQKIGLPNSIIQASKLKVGTTQVDFDKLLRDLEIEKNKHRQLSESILGKEKKLESTIQQYNSLHEELEVNKKSLLKKAKEEAKQLLADTNRKIESTIREIKEQKADKEITKQLRNELENYKSVLSKEEKDTKPTEDKTDSKDSLYDTAIKPGDYIRLKDTATVGEVISLKEKEVEIMIGSLRSTVKINRIIKISRKEYRATLGEEFLAGSEPKNFNILSKVESFYPILDLRGMRGEEALAEVTQFIDDAIILHAQDLKIIHGKGDGILRNLIRDHLRHYKQVQSLADEHADRGGAGVTLVKLK